MDICPLCNGIAEKYLTCPRCEAEMVDKGRIYDYFDDYSPHMDIEINKLEDGIEGSAGTPQCLHLFYCLRCGYDKSQHIDFE